MAEQRVKKKMKRDRPKGRKHTQPRGKKREAWQKRALGQ